MPAIKLVFVEPFRGHEPPSSPPFRQLPVLNIPRYEGGVRRAPLQTAANRRGSAAAALHLRIGGAGPSQPERRPAHRVGDRRGHAHPPDVRGLTKRGRPPELFWHDAMRGAAARPAAEPAAGSPQFRAPGLMVVANHPFGVVDGIILCWLVAQALVPTTRSLTHRAAPGAGVRPRILPVDFSGTDAATMNNLRSRRGRASGSTTTARLLSLPGGGGVAAAPGLQAGRPIAPGHACRQARARHRRSRCCRSSSTAAGTAAGSGAASNIHSDAAPRPPCSTRSTARSAGASDVTHRRRHPRRAPRAPRRSQCRAEFLRRLPTGWLQHAVVAR